MLTPSRFSFSIRISILSLVALALAIASPAATYAISPYQDAATETSLDDLLAQWKDLEAELVRKEEEFKNTVDTTVQDDIRGQYKTLVDQANEMVTKIKTAAIKVHEADPSNDENAKLLVGIIKNDAEFKRDNDAVLLANKLIAAGTDSSLFTTAAKADSISITTRELLEEMALRSSQKKADNLPQVKFTTSKGDITIELFEDEAPNTVANFVRLVEDKFYDGLKFHRVIEGFVAQGGDPKGDGTGGPGYQIKCECDEIEARRHFVGSLRMAHSGKDTGGSQFFICLSRTSILDGKHTVFGRVTDGIEVLDRLSRNYTDRAPIPNADSDVIKTAEVTRKREHDYKPEKIGEDKEEPTPPPAQPETLNNKEDSKEDSKGEDKTDEPSETTESSGVDEKADESSETPDDSGDGSGDKESASDGGR